MTSLKTLLQWCNHELQVELFKDYAPNGLQVEGRNNVNRILTSVTASAAAIEAAVSNHADVLLVHHGMFWKSEPVAITGWKKQRIATLLEHDINLVAYHLPLDVHPDIGNNAQLAKRMGWTIEQQCGEQNLLNIGTLQEEKSLQTLTHELTSLLQREPIVIGDPKSKIERIAWCTGGGQSFFQAAIDHEVDVFVTGEISEAQYHLANETGVAFISAGHHATERYGVQALETILSHQFNVETIFFDEANPA